MKWGIIGKAAVLQKEPGGCVTAKTDYLKNKIKQKTPKPPKQTNNSPNNNNSKHASVPGSINNIVLSILCQIKGNYFILLWVHY